MPSTQGKRRRLTIGATAGPVEGLGTWRSGFWPNQGATALADWETFRGEEARCSGAFNTNSSWTSLNNWGQGSGTHDPIYRARRDLGHIVEVTTSIIPSTTTGGDGGTLTTLAAAAAGDYDAQYTAYANQWASRSFQPHATNGGKIITRYCHEMLGNFYRWSVNANKDGGNPGYAISPLQGRADWKAAYINARTAMGVAQPAMEVWISPQVATDRLTASAPTTTTNFDQLLSGLESYVDGITVDMYNRDPLYDNTAYQTGSLAYRQSIQAQVWAKEMDTDRWGLQSLADLAYANNKPFALVEYGVWTDGTFGPGGDDGGFFGRVNAWLRVQANRVITVGGVQRPLLSHDWVNNDDAADGKHEINPGPLHPLARADYIAQTWGS